MAVIGIDLGGTKIAAALFDHNGRILHKTSTLLQHRQGREVGALITRIIADLVRTAKAEQNPVQAVGVSVPGIYYAKTGEVWAPNISDWNNYPLLTELQTGLQNKNIQVKIDSDRACYILGETWQGIAKGCKDAIFLAVGTGIGAGILVDGKILRGCQDIAGAIGWLALDRPFQSDYKTYGCFEYHAAGDGIARMARAKLAQNTQYQSVLRQKDLQQVDARDVFMAYQARDPLAITVLSECIEFWGMAVANLVSLFNPEMIILGGGVFGPAAQFKEQIRAEAQQWAQPISMKSVKLEISQLGSDAGLYGTGYLALQSLL